MKPDHGIGRGLGDSYSNRYQHDKKKTCNLPKSWRTFVRRENCQTQFLKRYVSLCLIILLYCAEASKIIRDTVLNFVQRCDTPCKSISMPDKFCEKCIEDAISLGYPMEGYVTLQKYFKVGGMMAYASYAHREMAVRMYIARYTAIHLYLDDHFKEHYHGLLCFNERLLRNEHQEEEIFQCLSKLLLELPQHFSPVACNLMTVSTLNYVASLIIEHDTEDMTVACTMLFL